MILSMKIRRNIELSKVVKQKPQDDYIREYGKILKEFLIQLKIQDFQDNMRNLLFICILLMMSCCSSNTDDRTVEAVFIPGVVDFSSSVIDTDYYYHKVDSIKNMAYYKYTISENAFHYLTETLDKQVPIVKTHGINPPIYLKIGQKKYILGNNRVLETGDRRVRISEYEDYKIKCLIHFYDFMYEDDVSSLPEVRKFGMPVNYWFSGDTRHLYTNVPEIKIIIKVR